MNMNANSRTPSVSVVITCFNYGRYVAGAVRSALEQTYDDCEIIVVDDGSTDDTQEVLKAFASHPRVRAIRQENGGQAKAKNAGIRHARGRFVAFLDADDLWEADKLEKQMLLFADPDVGVVYSRARYIDGDGKPLPFQVTGRYLQPRAGRVTQHLFLDNFVPFSSSVVRRECFDLAGCFDESLAMGIDWDLWLRISVHYGFAFVGEPLLLYRLGHAGQMSRRAEVRQECSDRIMARFMESHPEALTPALLRKAFSYTFRNRAGYFAEIDFRKSCLFYLKAIRTSPLEWASYRGLGKSSVRRLFRKSGLWGNESKSPT